MPYGVSGNLISKFLGLTKIRKKTIIYKCKTVEKRLEAIPSISMDCFVKA